MNVTDLRDELATRAHELDRDFDAAASSMSTGVSRKVTETKRRRTAGVAGAAAMALVVAAIAVSSRTTPTTLQVPAGTRSATVPGVQVGPDGMPYRMVPDTAGDVVKDGLRYRAKVADDTLVAGFLGDSGQGQFTLVWEPTTTHVSLGAECYLPGLSDVEARNYMVTLGLEGTKGFFGSQCSANRPAEPDLPAGGGIPGEPGQGWPELTLGQTARVRVQLVDAKTTKPAYVAGAQLTGAVYELGAQRLVKNGSGTIVAALPEAVEHQGYTYRIKSLRVAPVGGSLPQLDAPDGPFMLTYGSAGTGTPQGTDPSYSVTGAKAAGDNAGFSSVSAGGLISDPVLATAGATLALVADGPAPKQGMAILAAYTLDTP